MHNYIVGPPARANGSDRITGALGCHAPLVTIVPIDLNTGLLPHMRLYLAGLLLVPMDLMRSLGYSSSIVVAVTMLVNLTLTPALLLTMPRYFSKATKSPNPDGGTPGSARHLHPYIAYFLTTFPFI